MANEEMDIRSCQQKGSLKLAWVPLFSGMTVEFAEPACPETGLRSVHRRSAVE
jgi:hypothetical protein